jgi:hypothetical protein
MRNCYAFAVQDPAEPTGIAVSTRFRHYQNANITQEKEDSTILAKTK